MKQASKASKIIFWISTVLVALMAISGILQFNAPATIEMYTSLGFSADWFRWELTLAKVVAGVILLIPSIKGRLKEWTYAGLMIDFVSASIALTVSAGIGMGSIGIICTVLLVISYMTYQKAYGQNLPLV